MITMDGRKLKEFGYRAALEHYHEAIPNIRTKTMTIPGMPGQWDFGSELGSKSFEIPIRALSDDSFNLQQLQNELVAFLMDEYGNPREIKLVFDYEPDKYYTVKVDRSIAPSLRAHIIRHKTLIFVAHDPYKYSQAFADEVVWGSEVITFQWHYLLGHEGAGARNGIDINGNKTIDVTVDGLAIKPVFEIEGTASGLKIECGEYSFTLPNFTNSTYIVDFENYSVTKNGQEQILDGIDEFFLMPGNNQVKVTGTNLNINMRIKFRDKHN